MWSFAHSCDLAAAGVPVVVAWRVLPGAAALVDQLTAGVEAAAKTAAEVAHFVVLQVTSSALPTMCCSASLSWLYPAAACQVIAAGAAQQACRMSHVHVARLGHDVACVTRGLPVLHQ